MNVPGLKGVQTQIGSWTQIIGGLFYALAELFKLIADCANGVSALNACFDQLPTMVVGVIIAANGLSQLGIGSKVEDVKSTTKQIKSATKATAETVSNIENSTDEIVATNSGL